MATLAVSFWLFVAAGGHAGDKSQVSPELVRWAEGPVRWLLVPEEWRELRQAKQPAEAVAFIERFWARRNPDPSKAVNSFREIFSRRVEAADILYGDEGLQGSLTDRGRALILLGSPSHLRVGSEPVLVWDARKKKAKNRATTRQRNVEIWGYRISDLPAPLLEAAANSSQKSGEAVVLTLTFVLESRGAHLKHGEDLLELAARSAVRQ